MKLVVLILVCGSSGVGLLSVRQSRLQAAHEMAEARHRTQRLNEQAREIRTRIAQACTPDRVVALLEAQGQYSPAVHHPAKWMVRIDPEFVSGAESLDIQGGGDDDFKIQHSWILEDGSAVILLNE